MACGRCPGSNNPPSTGGCSGGNCFRALNITIPCSVAAPGESFSRDISLDNPNIKGCTGSVTYQLLSFASVFTGVTISEEGLLEGSFTDEAIPNSLPIIKYRIYCNTEPISATGKIFVCVKSLCQNIICDEDSECNPVTGECDPVVPNAILN